MRRALLVFVAAAGALAAALYVIGLPDAAGPAPWSPGPPPTVAAVPDAQPFPGVELVARPAPAPAGDDEVEPEPSAPPPAAPSPELRAHLEHVLAQRERRQQPDVQLVSVQMSTWRAIQYHLGELGSAEAQELVRPVKRLVKDLQVAFGDPDFRDVRAMQARQQALRARIEASGVVDDEIRAQLSRLDEAAARFPLD